MRIFKKLENLAIKKENNLFEVVCLNICCWVLERASFVFNLLGLKEDAITFMCTLEYWRGQQKVGKIGSNVRYYPAVNSWGEPWCIVKANLGKGMILIEDRGGKLITTHKSHLKPSPNCKESRCNTCPAYECRTETVGSVYSSQSDWVDDIEYVQDCDIGGWLHHCKIPHILVKGMINKKKSHHEISYSS